MLQLSNLLPNLVPQKHAMPNGNVVYYFPNESLEIVKLDITIEAGSARQEYKCQAHAASRLFGEATEQHTAEQMAEYIDFRGIVVEKSADVCSNSVSLYFLRKYANDVLQMVNEMFGSPVVTPKLFDIYRSTRRQQLLENFQKTSYVARNTFYRMLYGPDHPIGAFATPEEVDMLPMDVVNSFIRKHYRIDDAHIVISGAVDDELLKQMDVWLGQSKRSQTPPIEPANMELTEYKPTTYYRHCPMPTSVQSTVRIGRILPYSWDSREYAQFMVLNTVLGGYFGSRLMSNLREEKGYTYGIYSTTQIYRDSIVFYITADVAAEATNDAVTEIFNEIERLRNETVGDEELELVRNFMTGDLIRTVDGVFEISERYRQMYSAWVDESFTQTLVEAIANTTPQQLKDVAMEALDQLALVTAGPQPYAAGKE